MVALSVGGGHIRGKQASRCYEQRQQACDAFEKSLEQRDALCFQNEHSDVVWTRLHYKIFAETEPACRIAIANEGGMEYAG